MMNAAKKFINALNVKPNSGYELVGVIDGTKKR